MEHWLCSTWNNDIMATWSAMGISGWDPITSFGEGLMGQYFLDKSAKTQYKYAQKYAKWSALHGPAYTKQGLRDAGYNPMLAVSQGFDMPAFQTTGTPPSLGNSVSGYDPTVASALQTQKAERELLKAQTKKTETETGALAPVKALVSAIPIPQIREAIKGVIQHIFSTDGAQNVSEKAPPPSAVEKFKLWNAGKATWLEVGRPEALSNAEKLGLKGKELDKFVENARRRWNKSH